MQKSRRSAPENEKIEAERPGWVEAV